MTDPRQPGEGAPGGRVALIVDDDTVSRIILGRMMERCDYACVAAESYDAAVAALDRRPFDVVALDLSLADRDGIELLRELARRGQDPMLLFVSGFDERVREAAARLAVSLGLRVAGTVGKPLSARQLCDVLSTLPRHAPRPPGGVALGRAAPVLSVAVLEAALECGEIECRYQPKLHLASRRVTGFEALARWNSPLLGAVPPDVFIPFAERHGLIDQLTARVLDQAIAQLAQWRGTTPALELAVNLSPLSLNDLRLPERLDGLLRRHRVPPERLTLEITEGAVMTDYVSAADILTRIRIHGTRLAIDDFGTGQSSLLSLLRLPFNQLKIDQRFVLNLLDDPEARKIVRAVVALARSMEMELVAEGIESEPVAAALAALGIETGQGFLFAPALAAAAATALLAAGAPSHPVTS